MGWWDTLTGDVESTAKKGLKAIGGLAEHIGAPVAPHLMPDYPSSKPSPDKGGKKTKGDPPTVDKMKILSESPTSGPNQQGYFQPGGLQIPAFSPLAYQMFWQQAVAPMLAQDQSQFKAADEAYAKNMNDVMSLPYMKGDPVARSLLAQVPQNIHANDLMAAALNTAAHAGPAMDTMLKAMNQDTALLTANLHSYLTQSGANAGANVLGQTGVIGQGSFGNLATQAAQQSQGQSTLDANTANQMIQALRAAGYIQ